MLEAGGTALYLNSFSCLTLFCTLHEDAWL